VIAVDKIIDSIGLTGVLPVVTLENSRDAVPLAKALSDGGLSCIEITFRTGAAKEAISQLSKSDLPMLIGAGTVQSVDQVKVAVEHGARFIVTPGLNRKVVEYCIQAKIPVIPGVVTPSEIEEAIAYGLDVLKFFPAEVSGGVEYLKAIYPPYKKIQFVPTGGIDESNLLSYLQLPSVLACGGSWMVKRELIAEGKFDEVRKLSEAAMRTMLGFKLQHVGINSSKEEEARVTSAFLADMLRFESRDTPGSVFVGAEFEILKSRVHGEHGHIALGTNFIDRAVAYFDRRGIKTKPETRNEKDGKLATVYLDVDIGGFAVHLFQL
jgi:2-dehydro-3-deoxyphosphogluconate aldolase/(4S)-4-hydroxy-2-oxoglutarate aldolase